MVPAHRRRRIRTFGGRICATAVALAAAVSLVGCDTSSGGTDGSAGGGPSGAAAADRPYTTLLWTRARDASGRSDRITDPRAAGHHLVIPFVEDVDSACHAGVIAVDPRTGAEAWRYSRPVSCTAPAPELSGTDVVVIVDFAGTRSLSHVQRTDERIALDPATGRRADVNPLVTRVVTWLDDTHGLIQPWPTGRLTGRPATDDPLQLVSVRGRGVTWQQPAPTCAPGQELLMAGRFGPGPAQWTPVLTGERIVLPWACRSTTGPVRAHLRLADAGGTRDVDVGLTSRRGIIPSAPVVVSDGAQIVACQPVPAGTQEHRTLTYALSGGGALASAGGRVWTLPVSDVDACRFAVLDRSHIATPVGVLSVQTGEFTLRYRNIGPALGLGVDGLHFREASVFGNRMTVSGLDLSTGRTLPTTTIVLGRQLGVPDETPNPALLVIDGTLIASGDDAVAAVGH